MAFDKGEAEQLLADCGRHCCICGLLHSIQVHHIVPGDDTIENGIPLCPNCHNEVHAGYSPGRTTRAYTPEELKRHRKRTIDQVAEGKRKPDKNVREKATKIEKATSSKIIVSTLWLSPNQLDYLDMRVSFTNDSDKQFVIDIAYLVTADKETLLRINKSNITLDSNYINNITKFEPIDNSLPQKPNLPKTLTPGEIWITSLKESFGLKKYFKEHKLKGIRRMPIGIMMRFINYKGIMSFPCRPYFASEIYIHDDAETYGTSTIHVPMEMEFQL